MRTDILDSYWIVAVVAAYYSCAWMIVRRKRAAGSITVRYEPPRGLSPAAMRYVYTMGIDGRSYAAIIAQLAAGKLLAIIADQNTGRVTLQKLAQAEPTHGSLPQEEAAVFKGLFEWEDSVALKQPEVSAIERIEKALRAQSEDSYFTRNFAWVVVGLALTAAGAIWLGASSAMFGRDEVDSWVGASFAGLTVAIYGLAGYWMWDSNRLALTLALRGLYRRRTLPLLLFLIVLYPALWYLLIRTVAPQFAVVTTLVIVLNGLAGQLLRTYTAAGRKLRDEIEGFRRFLVNTALDQLQRVNVPGESPQIDPDMIPYAIALDLREAWGDQLGIKAMVETEL